jgi:hypothetical protein
VAFFKAMESVLIANVLTVTFVYCFAKISQLEQTGEQEGRLTYLWSDNPRLLVYALRALCLGHWASEILKHPLSLNRQR